ncbi:MAG: sulfatase [Phycisphaerae bacterium]
MLLITLDTTRADRLGCYGYGGGTSPNLDRLAAAGVVFERAMAQAAVTPVSHASILTGLNPYRHGLRVMHGLARNRLGDGQVTLAEVLEGAGYATAGFVSAFPASRRFGLGQGFETFDDDFGHTNANQLVTDRGIVNTGRVQRTAKDTTDRALAWLRARGDGSFFLWVHYFDPHDPQLLPPPEYLMQFNVPDEVMADTPQRLRAIYDIELRYMDLHIGRLIDALQQAGRFEETVTVVVADHGEGLGDHNWWTHGILYQEQIRVPLLVKAPGVKPGRRVASVVRTLDIMPTVLELAGVGRKDWPAMEGVSLAGVLTGSTPVPKLAAYADSVNKLTYTFAEGLTDNKDEMLFALLDWPFKFIYHREHPSRSELYDLSADPGELRNLLTDQPARGKRMIDLLAQRDFLPADSPEAARMSEAEVEKLKSLGYVK